MSQGLAWSGDSRVVSWPGIPCNGMVGLCVLCRGIAQCTAACNASEFGAVSWQVLAYHEVAWLDYCAVPWLDVA